MDLQLETGPDGRLVLTCAGEIGWDDRDTLTDKVRAVIDAGGQPRVLMDLAEVSYANSAGLGALFQLCKLVRERNGKLVLANTSPRLTELFRTVGLHQLAHLTETAAHADEILAQDA